MKIAIMQPYIFPYIGYFQLINTVDKFVFYDDVNFIKKGWVNRNQLLINGNAQLFTVPVQKASQNKLINEIELGLDNKWKTQFLKTLEFNYKKSPYFDVVYPLVQQTFEMNHSTIANLCIYSIKQVSNYLGLEVVFETSSEKYPETKGMEKAARLINICQKNQAKTYVNPSGGMELYQKDTFKKQDIDLFFIKSELTPYLQFNNNFVPGLSIIDVLMFNSKEELYSLLTRYKLK